MKLQILSEGAEAKVYSAGFLGFDGVLKRRVRKNYRIEQIDEQLRSKRTRNEARIIGLVSRLGIDCPKVLLVDRYEILMSRIKGVMLNDLLKSNADSAKFPRIFSLLGGYAALLHNNNIVHGDYTPANVILDKSGRVYLIAFGLSEVAVSIEEKALDLLLMKRAVDKKYFDAFIQKYKRDSNESKTILGRLNEIEKRGRYNTRTLLVN